MTVLIFSTSIQDKKDLYRISKTLNNVPDISGWTIDLEDYDKILRIEARDGFFYHKVEEMLWSHGFQCRHMVYEL